MKYENILDYSTSKRMKAGRVTLQPGEEVGEHVTEGREELIVVLKGTASVAEEGKESLVQAGSTHYIHENARHNVKNASKEELEYIYAVAKTQ